jgi:hypothetical protein
VAGSAFFHKIVFRLRINKPLVNGGFVKQVPLFKKSESCLKVNLYNESSAAVLVYSGSGIERRWGDFADMPFSVAPHDNTPAAFRWSHLDPVDIVHIKDNLFKPDSS